MAEAIKQQFTQGEESKNGTAFLAKIDKERVRVKKVRQTLRDLRRSGPPRPSSLRII